MKCQLITLAGTKYDGDFTEVLLTTSEGMMVALPHHEPLTATLPAGPVTIHNGKEKETFAVFGGLVEITPTNIRVLADVAEHSDDLVEADIQSALDEAERLKAGAKTEAELSRAQGLIDRQQVRLNVIGIRRRRHRDRPTNV